jgi:2-methylcitrate dehydratase PrpD
MSLSSELEPILDWLATARPLNETAVCERARLLLLDTLGCAVAGAAKPELRALTGGLARTEAGPVPVPGTSHRLAPQAAAYATAIAACWDEACEGLARAHGRPGLHALPVAMSLGAALGATLGQVLDATIVGYEVGGRLGEVMRIRPGMHVDGTWGLLAAAAAARSLLPGSSAATLAAAIAAAACQMPFGLYRPVAAGKTARNTYVGHGAAQGIAVAQATAAGITAPPDALDEVDRLALGGAPEGKRLAGPGQWLLLQGYFKAFAAVQHVHYGAAAAQAWRADGGRAADIAALRLDTYEEGWRYCGNRAPATAIQAQFSLTYGVAHTLVHGDLGPEAYGADALADPAVRRLEAMIDLAIEPQLTALGRRAARLTVTAPNGRRTIEMTSVLGDAARPMAVADVLAKFERYAGPVIGADDAARLAAAVLEAPLDTPIDRILVRTTIRGVSPPEFAR